MALWTCAGWLRAPSAQTLDPPQPRVLPNYSPVAPTPPAPTEVIVLLQVSIL